MQNPKYIEIDNMFYSGLIVVNYYREQEDLILKSLIETNINMNISMFYEKQNQYSIKEDRVKDWLKKGAVPSDTVKSILNKCGVQIER